jgi:putative FmdB family regulatory protein
MPLYDFACRACGERFEARVSVDELPACPACGAGECERLPSAFAGPFTVGVRGRAARRSDAARRVREEQRRERSAERQERRARGEDGGSR